MHRQDYERGEGPCRRAAVFSVGGSARTAVWRQESPLLCALDGVLALIKCARGYGLWFVSFDRPPTKAVRYQALGRVRKALTQLDAPARRSTNRVRIGRLVSDCLSTVCSRRSANHRRRRSMGRPARRWLSSTRRVSLQHDFKWAVRVPVPADHHHQKLTVFASTGIHTADELTANAAATNGEINRSWPIVGHSKRPIIACTVATTRNSINAAACH